MEIKINGQDIEFVTTMDQVKHEITLEHFSQFVQNEYEEHFIKGNNHHLYPQYNNDGRFQDGFAYLANYQLCFPKGCYLLYQR